MLGIVFNEEFVILCSIVSDMLLPYVYVVAFVLSYAIFIGLRIFFFFSAGGRIIRAKRKAKSFVKKEELIIPQNTQHFCKKAIGVLPKNYRTRFDGFFKNKMQANELFDKTVIREYSDSNAKIALAVYKTLTLMLLVIYVILSLSGNTPVKSTLIFACFLFMSYLQGKLLMTLLLFRFKQRVRKAVSELEYICENNVILGKQNKTPTDLNKDVGVRELIRLLSEG